VAVAVVTLMVLTSLASASDYCTKEQYERDHTLIADAFSKGTLVKGPKGLRDSILVKEDEWFKMNYLQQISFMQSFECSEAGLSGKQLLYMDVRSLAAGRLLATWTLGQLKPAEGPGYLPNSGRPEVDGPDVDEDENRIGLTGRARAALIYSTIDACRSKSGSQTFCSRYANAFADSVSIQELKEMSAIGNSRGGSDRTETENRSSHKTLFGELTRRRRS